MKPTPESKICKICKIDKKAEHYYIIKKSGQMHSYCKSCNKEYNNKKYGPEYRKKYYVDNKDRIINYLYDYYAKNTDKVNNRSKAYYAKNTEKHRATCKKWRENNQEASKAYTVLHNSKGLIKPGLCSCCKRVTRVEYHHFDYSRPLDGLWVCRSKHRRFHNGCKETIALFKKLWKDKYGEEI